MVGLFGYCNQPLIESLDKLAEKDGKVEMEEKFCSVALDIIGKSVFNYEFGSATEESPVVRAVYSALVEAEHRSMVRRIWLNRLFYKAILSQTVDPRAILESPICQSIGTQASEI